MSAHSQVSGEKRTAIRDTGFLLPQCERCGARYDRWGSLARFGKSRIN